MEEKLPGEFRTRQWLVDPEVSSSAIRSTCGHSVTPNYNSNSSSVVAVILQVYICWTLHLGIGLRYRGMDSRILTPILSHYSTLLLFLISVLLTHAIIPSSLHSIGNCSSQLWTDSFRYNFQDILTWWVLTCSDFLVEPHCGGVWFSLSPSEGCCLPIPSLGREPPSLCSPLPHSPVSTHTQLPQPAYPDQSFDSPHFSEPRNLFQPVSYPLSHPWSFALCVQSECTLALPVTFWISQRFLAQWHPLWWDLIFHSARVSPKWTVP